MDKRIKEKLDIKRRNQIIAGVAVTAALLIGLIYMFTRPEEVVSVRTEEVVARNLTSTLNYTSNVQPAKVQSEFAPNQKVLKLHVNVGDRVTAGQLLAELDTSELEKMVSDTESAFMDASSAIDLANLGMLNPDMLASMMPGVSTDALMAQLTSNLQSSLMNSIKGLGTDILGDLEFPGLETLPQLTPEQKDKLIQSLKKLENEVGEVKYTLDDFQLPTVDNIMGLDSIGRSQSKATLMKLSTDLKTYIDSKGEISNLPRDIASLTDGEKEILYNNISTLLTDLDRAILEEKPLEPEEESVEETVVADNPENIEKPVNETPKPNNSTNTTTSTPNTGNNSGTAKPSTPPKTTNESLKEEQNVIITDLSILSKPERASLYSYYGRLLQDLGNYLNSGSNVDLPKSITSLSKSEQWELYRDLQDVYDKLKDEFDSGMIDFDLGVYSTDKNRASLKTTKVSFGGFNMDMFSGTVDQGGNILSQLQYANSSASEMLRNAKKEIYAEFDGMVVAINGEEGETISSTMSTPFIEVYDDSFLTVTIYVNRNDAVKINVGQKVKYKIDDLELDGEVIFKSPIATENGGNIASMTTGSEPTVKIDMDIKGDNVKDLIIGFPIDSEIQVDSVINAISVPAQAVLRDQDEYYVYVLKDDIIRRRKIEMGVQTQEYVETKAGLLLGDVVVTNPNSNMKDGQRVIVDE